MKKNVNNDNNYKKIFKELILKFYYCILIINIAQL